MGTMPGWAEAVIALLYTVATVGFSSVGVPQTISLLVRLWSGDGLNLFRLMWVVVLGSLCLGLIYRAAIWVDLAVFDQAWLGPLAQRWPLEVLIAALVAVGSLYLSWLYWRTRKEHRP